MPTSMKLYMHPNACSQVTLTALEHIGCTYERQVVSFMAGDHMKPEFRKLSPIGTVPALVVDGHGLYQNSAILKFLADVYPDSGLLPKAASPLEAWEINSLFSLISADLHPTFSLMRFPQFFVEGEANQNYLANASAERLKVRLQAANDKLEHQEWLLGDTWSILDAYLSWAWFRSAGENLPASLFPAINDMVTRHYNLPVAKRVAEIEEEEIAELKRKGEFMAPKK